MIRRNSRQRQLILDVMRGEGIHMNADQVYQRVKQADPSIGIATVYRNLNLLTEMVKSKSSRTAAPGSCMMETRKSIITSTVDTASGISTFRSPWRSR